MAQSNSYLPGWKALQNHFWCELFGLTCVQYKNIHRHLLVIELTHQRHSLTVTLDKCAISQCLAAKDATFDHGLSF